MAYTRKGMKLLYKDLNLPYLIKDVDYDDIPTRCMDYALKNHDPEVLASRFMNILGEEFCT